MRRGRTRRFGALGAAFAALMTLAACSAASFLNAVTSGDGFTVMHDVRYADGARGGYDFYVPDDADARTPLVIFFYGGSWDSGEKSTFYFVGQSLAKAGYAVAIPDYRTYPDTVFPGFVEDGARATAAILAASAQGTSGLAPAPDRPLVLLGHSAGAQIASLLTLDQRYLSAVGVNTDRIAAFVGLSGPYDFLPLDEERYIRIFPEATRADSQPINFARGDAPPMLLATGLADTTVEPRNTLALGAAIEAAGGRVQIATYEGADHLATVTGFATAVPLGERSVRDDVIAFINRIVAR